MNLAKSKSKYLKCAIFIISVCILLGALSACLPFNISIPDKLEEGAIDNTAMIITPNATDGLGEFNNGYSYIYTDKDLIDKYRAGDAKTPYDLSIVKVDTSQARGTQKNPYVIASVDDWDRFAKNLDDGSIPSYGSEKYFVLAKDIDFDGKTFHPVRFFNGTFYGMGHKLKNLSVNGTAGWVYWNNTAYAQIPTSGTSSPYGYGVFCRTSNVTVCDLIIENFDYQQMPSTAVFNSRNETNTGGLVGVSWGEDAFLNCHSVGVIYSSITYSTFHMGLGGLLGAHSNTSSPLLMYRCSSEVNITANSKSHCQIHGGLVGDAFSGGNLYIYDCAANLTSNIDLCFHTACSAAIGIVQKQSLFMENFVGQIDVNSTIVAGSGSLIGAYMDAIVSTLENCYVEGTYGAATGTKYAYAGVCAAVQVTVNGSNINNINVVKPTGVNYWTSYASSYGIRLSGHREYATNSTMLADAKTFFGNNYSQIWDADKIGGSYDPDNSPVRNYLMAFIDFRNLNNSGNSEEKVGLDDGEPYIAGDKLPDNTSDVTAFTTYLNTKASANHVFLGWTDDKTGASEPFTTLPSGYFGEITLYAVWGLPQSYVTNNIKTSITSDKDKIEYDSVESITLTALGTHT
ncbi:MAG: hypothetical protein K2K85_07855, partial [Clostridia bacterium]|nr:hypothetical protein [Clostridia bacterium]